MSPKELHSPQFRQYETNFLQWLQTLGYSPATITTRKRNIREFLLYLERSGIQTIEQMTHYKVQRFVRYLQRRENKYLGCALMSASVNVGISTVNKFTQYLLQSQRMATSFEKLSYVQQCNKPKQILSIQEISQLYEATYFQSYFTSFHTKALQMALSQRDRAMLGIYYGCGLRKSEGVALATTDILIGGKLLLVRKGKGCKERYVPITEHNLKYLTEYMQNGRAYLLGQNPNT